MQGQFFFLIYTVLAEQLVALVAGNSEAYPYALEIFYWDRFYECLNPLYVFMFTYVLYTSRKLISFLGMLLQFVFNTALALVLGRSLGIGGVTIATAISQLITTLFYCIYVFLSNHGFHYRPYFSPEYLKTNCLLALPESSVILAIAVLQAGANALALNLYSIRGVTVVSLVINLYEIVVYMSEGISEYETVSINWAIGESSNEEIRYSMRITFRAVLVEGLLFLLGSPMIVDTFGIDDPAAAVTAVTAIRILALAPLALLVIRITAIFHQYTEKVGLAILLFLFGVGLIPLGFTACLSPFGIESLVLGITLGLVVTIACLWLFPGRLGKEKAINLRRTTVVFSDKAGSKA